MGLFDIFKKKSLPKKEAEQNITPNKHDNITQEYISNRELFNKEFDVLLRKAEAKIPDTELPDLPYMKEAPDVHDWYMFEHEIWDIGEEIRQLVVKHKKKFTEEQITRIISICLDRRAKRGRESFVMLLGKKAYCDYSEAIIHLLHDEDVDGHVIYTLYKMQAGQYVDLITPFAEHTRTWIRNEAKRYIQKYK